MNGARIGARIGNEARFAIAYGILVVVVMFAGIGLGYTLHQGANTVVEKQVEYRSAAQELAAARAAVRTFLQGMSDQNFVAACRVLAPKVRGTSSDAECAAGLANGAGAPFEFKIIGAAFTNNDLTAADVSVQTGTTASTFEVVRQDGQWLVQGSRAGL